MSSPPPIRRVSDWLQGLRRRIEDHFSRAETRAESSVAGEDAARGPQSGEERPGVDGAQGASAETPRDATTDSAAVMKTLVAAYDALFEERWEAARTACRAALASVRCWDERAVAAAIGWLIAAWRLGERAAVVEPLAALVRRLHPGGNFPHETVTGLCPHCGQAFRAHRRSWGHELRCRGCRHSFIPRDAFRGGAVGSVEPAEVFEFEFLLSADDRLMRDLALWLSLARVAKCGSTLSRLDDLEREALRRDLEFAASIDPGCADAPLIAGVIGLCQADEAARDEGRRQIELALARGASHPIATACLWHAGQLVQIPGPQLTDALWDGMRRLDELPALSELQCEFRRRWPGEAGTALESNHSPATAGPTTTGSPRTNSRG